ncbi:MAG: HD domain-containing protein [Treponema sp.]|nr:MAG: HD domain-containing protein [Treponema sp.]
MKKVAHKIFLACISAFLVVLIGFSSIAIVFQNMRQIYENSMEEAIENSIFMDKIRRLVNQELLTSSFYTIATSNEVLAHYEQVEKNIRAELTECLSDFGKRMVGNEKAKIFHTINAGCQSVFQDNDLIRSMHSNGSKIYVEQYILGNIAHSKEILDSGLNSLAKYIDSELARTNKDLSFHYKMIVVSFSVAVFMSIGISVVLTVVCTMFTSQLEINKNNLQNDIIEKTDEIKEQNKKIIYIQEQTIYGMANLIESRDSDTGEHVKRTSLYVELLGKAAKEAGYHKEIITDGYIEILKKAAPMHDIGKIAVSDNILKKPGKLTEEEFKKIQNHTIAGEKIIREVLSGIESEDYVKIAADIAVSHHERWDGNGYPYKLKGEEIPLEARIMAIADVFDALVSPRCYKDPFSTDEAFEIISLSRGTHFDPVLTDLFISKKDEVIKIFENN